MKTNSPSQSLRPAFALFLFALLAFSRGYSQVPALVNYQGRLANPDGSPLPTADYTLTFNVFDAATNGALVWGPQVFDGAVAQGHGARIPVVQGYFNVMLGPVDTTNRALSDAFNGAARYVEVTVSNRPPIAPRQQILTTPFAFQAANSAKLAGYDWSAVFGTNDPVAGTIPFSKLTSPQVGTNVGVGGIALSASSGNWISPTPASPTVVSNFSVTITTLGNPVEIFFVPDGSMTNTSTFNAVRSVSPYFYLALLRDGVPVGLMFSRVVGSSTSQFDTLPGAIRFLDVAPPGNHNYQLQMYTDSAGSPTVDVQWTRMVVREL